MQALIRADASGVIGTGHVMRCLVIADRLSQAGTTCLFVCRGFQGHLETLIHSRGHCCALLQTDAQAPLDAGYDDHPTAHASWLGSDWRQDAEATIEIVHELQKVDLAVVDHYALDHRWEERLQPHVGRLLAVDDLADRRHCADALVDQNYGQTAQHYAGLVPNHCNVLAGAQYALMSPQFAALRAQALARRQNVGAMKHLLIFLGGGDTNRAFDRVGKVLCDAGPGNLRAVTIVAGGAANGDVVGDALRSRLGIQVDVMQRVENMAKLMLAADLAIGGGGVTGWERCALGLPTLVVTLGENQRQINRRLAQDGHIFASVGLAELNQDMVAGFVTMDDQTYRTLSNKAATVTDGLGAARVLDALGYR